MLAVFRQKPFKFTLTAPKAVTTPFAVYINNDYTQQGSHDLIQHTRDLSIEEIENWSSSELLEASQAKTIYIIYDAFDYIRLDFSSEVLSIEEIQENNPDASIWVSHDATQEGLITLVNELLDWMV